MKRHCNFSDYQGHKVFSKSYFLSTQKNHTNLCETDISTSALAMEYNTFEMSHAYLMEYVTLVATSGTAILVPYF